MKKLLFAMTTVLMALTACSTQGTDENQEATAANQDNGQAAIENIMTRTSIRQYKDQPVEQEKIDIMLKAAMAAPTAVNLQPWHFIVITDKKTIGLLSGKQPTNAPLLIAMCGDTDKTTMPDGQGTAADIIKAAMVRVWRRLKQEVPEAKLILQIHDELIVEAPEHLAEQAAEILHTEMVQACELSVPLTADVQKGQSWYDAKG